MQLKQGDILASRLPTFISKAIRLITRSKYSHTAIVISDTEIIEADGIFGHIRIRPIQIYKGYADIYSCDITDEQRIKIIEYAKSRLGQRYDYLLLFVLFLRQIGIKIKYKDSEADICSEFCNDCYKSIGVKLSKKRFPIPQEIVNSKLLRFVKSI